MTEKEPILYFDHSATTPVYPEAVEAMTAACALHYGNPSSRHTHGREAAAMLNKAKEQIMQAIGAKDGMLIFTSGGTEANNLAILGRAEAKPRLAGGHIITTVGEHASVEEPIRYLETKGYTVSRIPTKDGELDFSSLTLSPKTLLASSMTINNETGAVYNIKALSDMVHEHCPDALFHTDATQAFFKIPFSPASLGADMITVSGHKVGAPKGIGALWISKDVVKTKGIVPRLLGGGQDNGMRSGTENVPGIVAFGKACEIGKKTMDNAIQKTAAFRQSMVEALKNDSRFQNVKLNIPQTPAPHILSLSVPGLPAETLLNFLSARGICVSAGSACSSNNRIAKPSDALSAFGLSQKEAASTIRLSFSSHHTEADKERFLSSLHMALTMLYRR